MAFILTVDEKVLKDERTNGRSPGGPIERGRNAATEESIAGLVSFIRPALQNDGRSKENRTNRKKAGQ